MRLYRSWIMSTASLSAQEISVPFKSTFLHGSPCQSMSEPKAYWDQHHDLNNLCFGLDAASLEYNLRPQKQVLASAGFERAPSHPHFLQSLGAQRLPPKKSCPSPLILPSATDSSMPSSPEGDQVVPSFKRLSVYEQHVPHALSRGAKPLPPLPGSVDPSCDEAVDNEVEFFNSGDESSRLVPESCPKALSLRYGAPSRRSFRGCGQINYAYFEGPSRPCIQEQQMEEQYEQQKAPEQAALRDSPRQQDRPQRRLRRSHSGPAGSFNKPGALRLSCYHHAGYAQDKPEVPPRVPIPPRPFKIVDHRRWSAEMPLGECGEEDKPPKVPPREPLSSSSSRTPSPKSLPTYINGVMPPTQSFAPNPKYVSKALLRQNSEGSHIPSSPCILPIMENGKKASTTHYFLLPKRPAYLDKFERFFRESDCEANSDGASRVDWEKAHIDMV